MPAAEPLASAIDRDPATVADVATGTGRGAEGIADAATDSAGSASGDPLASETDPPATWENAVAPNAEDLHAAAMNTADPATLPLPGLLTLMQWLSPSFPTGGFAYSHGIEVAVTAGRIRDAASLRDWLGDVLSHGAGRQDAILLAHALRDDADHAQLAALALALQPSSERLAETLDQGSAFARTVRGMAATLDPAEPTAIALPVAVGQAAAGLGLPPAQVVALYLHSFASNLVSGAVRFIPLGQTEGQAVLAALHPRITGLAAQAISATLDDIGSAAFGSDLAAMEHETLAVRIFRT